MIFYVYWGGGGGGRRETGSGFPSFLCVFPVFLIMCVLRWPCNTKRIKKIGDRRRKLGGWVGMCVIHVEPAHHPKRTYLFIEDIALSSQ